VTPTGGVRIELPFPFQPPGFNALGVLRFGWHAVGSSLETDRPRLGLMDAKPMFIDATDGIERRVLLEDDMLQIVSRV